MTNILILGANGQIARLVRNRLLQETNVHLTLYLRRANRIGTVDAARETVVAGDINDTARLTEAMQGQDIVYANLGGVFEPMAASIVTAMQATGVSRLIYVTGLGLYHEVPNPFGDWVEQSVGHEVMEDTRRAAAIIEAAPINATIIRAAYMSNDDRIDYALTTRNEPFKGTIISRKSIADLIVNIVVDPSRYADSSLGISQPGTDGPVPMY